MIDHLSFSSITRYLKCGKQWKYKYLEKLPEESSDALSFGSAWHKMIRLSVDQKKEDIEYLWTQSFKESFDIDHELAVSELSADDIMLHELGTRMVLSPKISTTIQSLTVNPETLEMPIELQIPNVPIPVIGFVDFIGGDGTPTDVKTASKKWNQNQADSDLQATFYLASLAQLGMIELPAKFRYMIFTKTKNPDVQVLETTRTHADIFALYSLISDVYQAIQKEMFLPTNPVNWWCSAKYCSFYDVCEYGGKNDK